jgi:hypothetical protein
MQLADLGAESDQGGTPGRRLAEWIGQPAYYQELREEGIL